MSSIQIDNQTLSFIATSAGIVASAALLALTCRVSDCFRNRPAAEVENPFPLNGLPPEVLGHVREHLSPIGRGALAQTCKKQAGIANQYRDKEWGHIADLLGYGIEAQTKDFVHSDGIISAFRSRTAKSKYADICKVVTVHGTVDPKTAAVEVVLEKYQEIYDQSLLIFANKVADALGNGPFTDAAAARTWFQDTSNQTALDGIQSLDLENSSLKILPAEIGQLRQLTLLYLGGNQLESLPATLNQELINGLTPAEIDRLMAAS